MPPLAELVAHHIESWETASVEQGVFETTSADAVAGYVQTFAQVALGSPVAEGLFYGSSAGCVAGVELEDGRRAVVKAYQRQWGVPFLSAVHRVQGHLAQAQFPCPRPLMGPGVAGPALATAEEWLPDPGMRTLETEAEMKASASGLARQVEVCLGLSEPALGTQHPLRSPVRELYPQPHNPIFDFSLDAGAARWIDELAAAAKEARATDHSSPAIIHADWSARNVRIEAGELLVAYDWDSLSQVTASAVVGQAAATWRSTGEASDPIAPGPDEVRAYLSAYEIAAGRPFNAVQRRAAMAGALWVLAYTARCEHALQAANVKRVDRARARLAEDGWAYLR